ncbi:MAG: hypothetical protein K2X93_27235 [Candidatus Obscuribacterales bacterium]|nr:hypothetical protein [Candidatus Obscuribacterales bacterium]
MSDLAKDMIINLEQAETDNFKANAEELVAWELLDAWWKLSDCFWQLIQKQLSEMTNDEVIAISNSLQLIRQDVLKGMVNLVKGYITDSSFQFRRVIETTASIVHLMKGAEKSAVWKNVVEDDGIESYVKEFPAYKLVSKNLTAELKSQYDLLCLLVHPSAMAMSSRAIFVSGGHELQVFDVNGDSDIPKLRKYFLMHLSILHNCLLSLVERFRKSENFDDVKWQEELRRYESMRRSILKHLIDSRLIPRPGEDTIG